MKRFLKIALPVAAVLLILLGTYFFFFHAKELDSEMAEKIQIEKIAYPAHTVSEGGEITYTVSITNENARRVKVSILDALPENTTLVSGDFSKTEGGLSAALTVGRGKTKSVSYTVRIDASYETGDCVVAPAASVLQKKSGTVESFVGRTLNAAERARMHDGILALMYSENIAPVKNLKDMYVVAFSETITLSGTVQENLDLLFAQTLNATGEKLAATVVPSLYRAPAAISDLGNRFRGESILPKKTDFVIGDILLAKKGSEQALYIFGGEGLVSMMNGAQLADTAAVLSALSDADCYAVLRPSLALVTLQYALEPQNETLSEAQKAVIATAKAYLQRGYRVQYDDTRMYSGSETADRNRGEYRWQIGQYNPEDYTADKWGYLNCAAFTYDAYRTALGLDLGSLYTTHNLAAYYVNGGVVGEEMYPYVLFPQSGISDGQKNAVKNTFMQTLEAGDLVVVRRSNGSGHVMLYIGDGVLIHSGGSNFDYANDAETYEPTIRYMNVQGYLFNPSATNYVFREDGYITSLCIVRPLDRFEAENMQIPENTLNRMQNLEGVYAEKLSSHPEGKTANVGEELTFTFRIENRSHTEKTLKIEDVVPAAAKLKSKGDFSRRLGGALTAKVTLAPGEEASLSYTVTVTAEAGTKIHETGATVGGVLHSCAPITVAKTLTATEQAKILAAAEQLRAANPEKLKDFDLVSEIYRAAGLDAPFVKGASVRKSLITEREGSTVSWILNEDSAYASMLAPTLYGGRRFFTPQQYVKEEKPNTDRSRLPREQALVVGDVLVVKYSTTERIYMYLGEGSFVNLSDPAMPLDTITATERLMQMMAVGNYYLILRPSMG